MTDKILIERAVLEQALNWAINHGETVYASGGFESIDSMNAWAEALRAALEQPPVVEQEAVAWRWIGRKGWVEYGPTKHDLFDCEPLYTHPQPSQPLTPEAVNDLWIKHARSGAYIHAFAQAIERAHGIK